MAAYFDSIEDSAPPSGPSIWGDEAEDHAQAVQDRLADNEYQRLQETHRTVGYLEGIEQGKPETLPQGFDEGFVAAGPIGQQIGYLVGVTQFLLMLVDTGAATSLEPQHIADLKRLDAELNHDAFQAIFTKERFIKKDRLASTSASTSAAAMASSTMPFAAAAAADAGDMAPAPSQTEAETEPTSTPVCSIVYELADPSQAIEALMARVESLVLAAGLSLPLRSTLAGFSA